MADERFQLPDVRFIKRIVVGTSHHTQMKSEDEIEKALALLNRCLTDTPKGVIIGMEKSFILLNLAEHQMVLQYLVYHIGFPRRPMWLE